MKCIKGDRNVNRYYFRQIPRAMTSMVALNMKFSQAPARPVLTDDHDTFAPRYITYKEVQVGIFATSATFTDFLDKHLNISCFPLGSV